MNFYFAPTKIKDRIEILDVIRGFAVFGILLSNILIISGYHLTPYADLAKLHLPGLNNGLYMFSFFAIIGKAYPLFCMLFGISFYMQYVKYKEEEGSFVKFFLWRMVVLFFIGIFHVFIWPGDVVHYYAAIGILLIPFRRLKAKYTLIISIVFFAASILIAFTNQHKPKEENSEPVQERLANIQFKGIEFNELKQEIQNNGIKGMWLMNNKQYQILYSFNRLKTAIVQILAFFLLGIFLFSKKLITRKLYNWKYLLVFLILGGIGKYLALYVSYNLRIIEHVFLSLFFVSLLGIVYKTKLGKKVLYVFSPVGRMALTNYVLQSLLAIFVFYGVGLGYFSEIPLYGIYLIACGILLFQTLFSVYWLRTYKYGPIEWFWRTLSYYRNFSLKNKIM